MNLQGLGAVRGLGELLYEVADAFLFWAAINEFHSLFKSLEAGYEFVVLTEYNFVLVRVSEYVVHLNLQGLSRPWLSALSWELGGFVELMDLFGVVVNVELV